MDLKLHGKSAFISGSSKGIGFAIAHTLAGEGATVIVNGRTESAVADAISRIRADHPRATLDGFAGDLATAAAVTDLVHHLPSGNVLPPDRFAIAALLPSLRVGPGRTALTVTLVPTQVSASPREIASCAVLVMP